MKKLWHSSISSSVRPQSVQPAVANGFTKAACRQMAMLKKGEVAPNFVCPRCNHRFHLHYGVFGKTKTFGENEFHCRDCAKLDGFTKAL